MRALGGCSSMNAMIYAKAIARQRFTPVMALRSLQRTEKMDAQPAQLMTLLHGGSSTLPKPVKIERRKRGPNRG